jgi:hypothetical protein
VRAAVSDATFDSTFTVAVLQHINDVSAGGRRTGARDAARRPHRRGRARQRRAVLLQLVPAGAHAYEAAGRFFAALSHARGDATDPSVGPKLPTLFAATGSSRSACTCSPSRARSSEPAAGGVWEARRGRARPPGVRPTTAIRRLGQDYLKTLDRYADEAGGGQRLRGDPEHDAVCDRRPAERLGLGPR